MASTQPTSGKKGCFKCGQQGHWSRDCTSQGGSYDPVTGGGNGGPSQADNGGADNTAPPVIKPSRKRPKLDPDLLLSENGLGYVLENFPKQVHFKGKGHEVGDLRRLLEAYLEWQERLFSYLPFSQFVEKVEKIGRTKRIRLCLNDLRQKVKEGEKAKVAQGGHGFNYGSGNDGDGGAADDGPIGGDDQNGWGVPDPPANDVPVDIFEETMRQAMGNDEGTQPTAAPSITEEQKARMEANRMRAIARAQERKRMAAAATAAGAASEAGPSASSANPPADADKINAPTDASPVETDAPAGSRDINTKSPEKNDVETEDKEGDDKMVDADWKGVKDRSVEAEKSVELRGEATEGEDASDGDLGRAEEVEKAVDEYLFDEEDEAPLPAVRGGRRRVVIDDDE